MPVAPQKPSAFHHTTPATLQPLRRLELTASTVAVSSDEKHASSPLLAVSQLPKLREPSTAGWHQCEH